MNPDTGGCGQTLNESQQRHLRVGCRHADKLLSEIESILNSSVSKSVFPSMPAETAFDGLIRGVPVFDVAELNVAVPCSAIDAFGARFAAKQLARQLASKIGPVLDQHLATYAGLLRSGAMSGANQLKRAFDVYADSYRAHTERALAGATPGAGEVEEIAGDLALLAAGSKVISSREDRSQDAEAKSFSRAATGRFVEGE